MQHIMPSMQRKQNKILQSFSHKFVFKVLNLSRKLAFKVLVTKTSTFGFQHIFALRKHVLNSDRGWKGSVIFKKKLLNGLAGK